MSAPKYLRRELLHYSVDTEVVLVAAPLWCRLPAFSSSSACGVVCHTDGIHQGASVHRRVLR